MGTVQAVQQVLVVVVPAYGARMVLYGLYHVYSSAQLRWRTSAKVPARTHGAWCVDGAWGCQSRAVAGAVESLLAHTPPCHTGTKLSTLPKQGSTRAA